MKNKVFPTKLTQGASYEQVKIEKEMNDLIVKSNKQNFILILLTLSIIGIPVATVIFLVKCKQMQMDIKRIDELAEELDRLILEEAKRR